MQILFHLGVHCTDDDLLIRSILRNKDRLATEGILVPGPARYRNVFREVSTKLRGAIADEKTETAILDAICDTDSAERIVLSNENFLCRPDVAVGINGLYPKIEKSTWLRNCLPNHEIEFALAIRNPASFVPDLIQRAKGKLSLTDIPIAQLQWSDTIQKLIEFNPGTPITIWCHEDTPSIWSTLIEELTAHDPGTKLEGAFDMLETIMTDEGVAQLSEFLDANDVTDELKRRRAISAFLEAHAIETAVETEIDLPNWTDATIDVLSEFYEQDVERIANMSGVTFIAS